MDGYISKQTFAFDGYLNALCMHYPFTISYWVIVWGKLGYNMNMSGSVSNAENDWEVGSVGLHWGNTTQHKWLTHGQNAHV